jgi:plasmid stabilization system protein ParE
MRIVFSDESRRDLRDITGFIAADSRSRARSYVAELASACTSLADQPLRYPLIPNYESLALRRRPYGNYAIIYFAEGDVVTIVRILHSAMDLSSVLGD